MCVCVKERQRDRERERERERERAFWRTPQEHRSSLASGPIGFPIPTYFLSCHFHTTTLSQVLNLTDIIKSCVSLKHVTPHPHTGKIATTSNNSLAVLSHPPSSLSSSLLSSPPSSPPPSLPLREGLWSVVLSSGGTGLWAWPKGRLTLTVFYSWDSVQFRVETEITNP